MSNYPSSSASEQAPPATALTWLIPGSCVTAVAYAPSTDPRFGGADSPCAITAVLPAATKPPGAAARRRITVMLGAIYGGSWSGSWDPAGGRVQLRNAGDPATSEAVAGGADSPHDGGVR